MPTTHEALCSALWRCAPPPRRSLLYRWGHFVCKMWSPRQRHLRAGQGRAVLGPGVVGGDTSEDRRDVHVPRTGSRADGAVSPQRNAAVNGRATWQDRAAPRLPVASAGHGTGPGVGGPRQPRLRARPAPEGRGLKEVHTVTWVRVQEMLEATGVLVSCAAAEGQPGRGRGAGGRGPWHHHGDRRHTPPGVGVELEVGACP